MRNYCRSPLSPAGFGGLIQTAVGIRDRGELPSGRKVTGKADFFIGAADMRRAIEQADARGPANGARLVARCWVDPAFEQRVLASVNDAARELGLDLGSVDVRAVKDTERVHNVIVCTLC